MHQQRYLAAAALAACLFLAAARFSAAKAPEGSSDSAIARTAAAELMTALKNELQAAMRKGGPVAAIDICSTRAQALTAEIPARIGRPEVTVRRTSLKLRNPANRPGPEEAFMLRQFAAQAQEGKTPHRLPDGSWLACVDGKTNTTVFDLRAGAERILRKVRTILGLDTGT